MLLTTHVTKSTAQYAVNSSSRAVPCKASKAGAAARCRSRVVLTRSSEIKIEAAAVDVAIQVPDTSVPTATADISDLEEFAWNRAQTKISIFSAQQYVENYLTPPFKAGGYVNLNFIDVSASVGASCWAAHVSSSCWSILQLCILWACSCRC
jgi:hypothetical protein